MARYALTQLRWLDMLNAIFQSATILCAATAFAVLDRVMTHRFDSQRASGGTATNWGYMLASVAIAFVLIAQPLLWPGLTLQILAPWGMALQLVGLIVVAASLALYAWARVRLGAFYAQRAEVQPGHRVIRDGPYAYVRHPIFVAYFLVSTGLLLVLPSLPMAIAALYTYALFTQTSLRDEALLRVELPGYLAYMAGTPRFFPRLLGRRPRLGGEH
jgi:protein-S-isoprenylcysteine O-methyltransferase Ste14